tara:strand:+ start:76552 stop:77070 length:519 start_codon:yes stop_codon:yes gene_type:complete
MNTQIKFSKEQWETLVVALRNEIEEFGALVNLLDEQQNRILGRDPEGITEMNKTIDEQIALCRDMRRVREDVVTVLASGVNEHEEVSVRALLSYFPEEVQGLLQALSDEIFDLMEKTQRKAGQNQMLLVRAFEAVEQVVRALCPELITKTYDKKGSISVKAPSDGTCMKTSV